MTREIKKSDIAIAARIESLEAEISFLKKIVHPSLLEKPKRLEDLIMVKS